MKKCLATMGIVMCLLILAGCGSKKMIASQDDTSAYPYGWQENADGSVTVMISGKWDKDCVWQPSYDAEIFEVVPQKTAGSFTVKGLTEASIDATSLGFTSLSAPMTPSQYPLLTMDSSIQTSHESNPSRTTGQVPRPLPHSTSEL